VRSSSSAAHVACWGSQMYERAKHTLILPPWHHNHHPGTITITNSATFTHSQTSGRNGLLSALERGWADAAVSLVPIPFVHPPITQPVLTLGLSLRGWMLKPLSLELVRGPMGPSSTFHFSPWQHWAFLMGVYRPF